GLPQVRCRISGRAEKIELEQRPKVLTSWCRSPHFEIESGLPGLHLGVVEPGRDGHGNRRDGELVVIADGLKVVNQIDPRVAAELDSCRGARQQQEPFERWIERLI